MRFWWTTPTWRGLSWDFNELTHPGWHILICNETRNRPIRPPYGGS
jgi:hypothetical protein